jgi:DUF1680 family protein
MRSRAANVVDTTASPYARLRPVPVSAVRLEDDFWAPRIERLRQVTLPTQYEQMEETGRLDNFRRAAGKLSGDFQGIYFNDSDVYKWVEAVAWTLAYQPHAQLEALLEAVIADIAAAQGEDGYLNTYFTFERAGERWSNLRDMHELYCAGHLFQAAVAHHRATGRDTLLQVARRFADYIISVFNPQGRQGTCGHPEIEMALVELYRATGERRYLEQAQFFLDQRGRGLLGGDPNLQDHLPFRELSTMTGHAVRALYLNCGATDLLLETGEEALRAALERLWENLTQRRMYVTGGCGARAAGEAFGEDYELPNRTAYAETCAAIANVMWNWRLLLLTGQARYTEVMELALYNGALAGLALDGRHYFYVNPLASRGEHRRQAWFPCACCPPNIARLLAALPGYLYSTSPAGLWVHLYADGCLNVATEAFSTRLCLSKAAPGLEIILWPGAAQTFSLFLRIPAWARQASLAVNEKPVAVDAAAGTYAELRREWQDGDRVQVTWSEEPQFLEGHPWVEATGSRVALRRGPFIYCWEQADNPGFDVWDLAVDPSARLEAEARPDLLEGVWVVRGAGLATDTRAWQPNLYLPLGQGAGAPRPVRWVAIPYFAWANREPGPMQVWCRLAPR